MKIKDRKTTVTLSNNVWKMLQMKKIEGNYRTLEDVIYSMLIKEEAKEKMKLEELNEILIMAGVKDKEITADEIIKSTMEEK